jgi:hypothetical protein
VSINGQSEGSRVCIQKELISRRISPLSICTYSAINICVAFDNDYVFCQRRDGDGATLARDDAGTTDQDGNDGVYRAIYTCVSALTTAASITAGVTTIMTSTPYVAISFTDDAYVLRVFIDSGSMSVHMLLFRVWCDHAWLPRKKSI